MRAPRSTSVAQRDRLALERDAHRARARHVEQALRDVLEPRHVLARRVDQRSRASEPCGSSRAREQVDRHAQRGERRAQLVRERRHQLLAARLLVAQVGDVLERQDQARRRAVARAQRGRAQHEEVVAPAQEHRDLDRLGLALGMGQEVARPRRAGAGSADAWCRARGTGARAPSPRSRSRIAHAISFTCTTTPSGSSTTRPSSMLSITASVFAFSASTASMRVRSIATAAWPASASSSWRWSSGRNASGRSPCSASTPTQPRTVASGTCSHSLPGSVSVPRPAGSPCCEGPRARSRARRRRAPRPAGARRARAAARPRAAAARPARRTRCATCSTIPRSRSSTSAAPAISRAKA